MNLISKLIHTILLLFLVLAVNACTHDKVYKIGVSQCSQDDWREKMNDEINREIMLHNEAVVEIRSADDNSAKQIEDIRYFVDNDFDILIVSPNEAAALTPIIKEVYESGMPVIIFDRNIIGDSYTARIGVDDVGLGNSAAQYALNALRPGAKAIEIYGLRGSTPAEDRHTGFTATFEQGGGEVLASEPANWREDLAVDLVDSLLDIYNNVDIIYAHNDRMAIGASKVAHKKGRDDIKIIGIDAAPNIGIQAVADSVIDATFLYPTEGPRIVRKALAILKGEPFERETILPASSAVGISNADILLRQNENLVDEAEKMKALKVQIDEYWEKHSSQTSLFYACIVIIVLLFGVVFLVLRVYWQHRRHQEVLLKQNKDLEEQRDKERELNEKLQEATQSKLMFFTNVSHDLRTPLTLITEPVNQLTAADNLTPQQHKLMKIADKNVRILHRLINQILDFRKYENDKLDLNLTEVNLGQAITDWLESFYSLARKRHIKLSADINNDVSAPTLAVDIEKIERVFFNLVSNAFKYTPDNGAITVSYRLDGQNAIITVTDTGQGISERDLGNIFDRFYQVDRIHPNGSGIGLSLCKAFVEMHSGKIEVESTLKKGSVFEVTLPVSHVAGSAEPVQSTITQEDIEAELGVIEDSVTFEEDKPLLLVIDDNTDIQHLITELMSEQYNVIRASGGSEGIKKAVKYVPDIIICDVMMPVMDGLECCRRLKAEVTTSHIPVLMLTACSMDEQRVQGYESGADGYLAKPFNSAVLISRCSSLIANRKRIKEIWQQIDLQQSPVKEPKEKAVPKNDIDNDFYNRFLKIFSAEIGNSEISVDDLAAKMGLERSQLYRKIKSLTNYSPVELIKRLRLKQAQTLLKTTDKSVSEIAYETGFSTPAYFTRCYRESFGETPSETRSNLTA